MKQLIYLNSTPSEIKPLREVYEKKGYSIVVPTGNIHLDLIYLLEYCNEMVLSPLYESDIGCKERLLFAQQINLKITSPIPLPII